MKEQLDQVDKQIIDELMQNARKSYLQIAKDLGISNSLVHQRINKLKELNIISSPFIQLNEKALGYQTYAYIRLMVSDGYQISKVISELVEMDEVVECSYISGEYSLQLKVFTKNNETLRTILQDQILMYEGVLKAETIVGMGQVFSRPLPLQIRSLEKEELLKMED